MEVETNPFEKLLGGWWVLAKRLLRIVPPPQSIWIRWARIAHMLIDFEIGTFGIIGNGFRVQLLCKGRRARASPKGKGRDKGFASWSAYIQVDMETQHHRNGATFECKESKKKKRIKSSDAVKTYNDCSRTT